MDDSDPITQFFPGRESVDLYGVLGLTCDATVDEIKKSYRRSALIHHPDKQTNATESTKVDASTKFQQIGFAYAVLSDEKRRKRYDKTGKTDEGFQLSAGEDGWEAYFEEMFDRVTRGKLDEMKKEYQDSPEEMEDIKLAYVQTGGAIGEIMNSIPHSTHDDEPRFIILISDLISNGALPCLPTWKSSIKDEKSRLVRKKQGQKEAKEAEELAKELDVWDEFYGSGKTAEKKGKGQGKSNGSKDHGEGEGEEDHSALQSLILKKRKNMDGFFDDLAAKYSEPEPRSKTKGRRGKKKAQADDSERDAAESPKRKSRRGAPSPPPDIDDDEFEKLQQKLFGNESAAYQGNKNGKRVN